MSRWSFLRRVSIRPLAILVLAGGLAACGPSAPEFTGTDITGTRLGRDLALTDQHGKARDMASFNGKVAVMFFGFTQCPDVCPAALAELAEVKKNLGKDADALEIVMITVDPERDTPEVLKSYVEAFDPSFVGLTGTPAELKATAGSFKAYYAPAPQKDGAYTMDHTASFYIFDKKGDARVLAANNIGVAALTKDVQALM